MRKNYFLNVFGILLCLSLYSQSSQKSYKDSTQYLAKAANTALDNYDYSSAIEHSLKLIDLASSKEDYTQLNLGHNFLGITYEVLEDTLRAKENYKKALEHAKSSNNDTLLWYAYNNLGNIYSSNKKTIQKGLEYYRKAIEIASKLPNSEESLTPVVNIGWTYLENGQYDQALPYLQKVQKTYAKDQDPTLESNLRTLYGMYYSGKGDFEKARANFEKGIEVAEKDSLIVEASFSYKEYSKMLFKSGNFDEAYAALQKHQAFREEMFQQEKDLQRNAVYEKFETEGYKKSLAAAQRERQFKDEVIAKNKQLSFIMGGSLLVMLIFLILLFRNNRIRKKLIGQLKDKNQELIVAKEEAERLTLLKTRFFSTVSHELRTPLYGVVGLTSLLLEDNNNEKQKEDLISLKFSADYLLALINDVLQVNKMESNLVHLEKSNFNIEELFQGIVKSFETTRNLNNNRIELQIDPDIPRNLKGDSMRLSQIMMNLVGNAVKFTENGVVWIKAEKRSCPTGECSIYFEVGDTGVGIPNDKQEDIFEEFSQIKSTNFNYQGTGLGLPIVKKLLQLFDSEIQLKSELGKGSVFSFVIDFEKGKEIRNSEVLGWKAQSEARNFERKILIVDDNRINQVVTQRILEKRDFICKIAASGQEAIEILRSEQLDVVLMDVNMPGMNGMETTMEIRKFDPDIPIIALTAVEVGELREEIFAAGMNDIINKPYDIPQFFTTIFKNLLHPADSKT